MHNQMKEISSNFVAQITAMRGEFKLKFTKNEDSKFKFLILKICNL